MKRPGLYILIFAILYHSCSTHRLLRDAYRCTAPEAAESAPTAVLT